MSHDLFLRSIIAEPTNDLPRLVYADWLEENGHPAQAEFIRVQCELAALPEDDPRCPGFEDREHELLNQHESEWVQAVPESLQGWTFHRGLIEEIAGSHLGMSKQLFQHHPIIKWTVTPNSARIRDVEDNLDADAVDCLSRIRVLDLSRCNFTLPECRSLISTEQLCELSGLNLSHRPGLIQLVNVLQACLYLSQLRSLAFGGRSGLNFRWADADNETIDVYAFVQAIANAPLEHLCAFDCGLTGDGLRLLLSSPFAEHLKSLDISDNHIAPDAWRAFATANPRMRLQRLNVSGTPLANTSLRPILDAKCLEPLEVLEINRCGSARVNMEVIAGSRFWTQAKELHAHGGTIPASTLEPLCAAIGPPCLRILDLADNYVRTEGVKLISEAPWAGSLTCLMLSRNYLDDESLKELADCGRFTKLRTLHLAHNNLDQDRSDGEVITDTGVRRLAATPSLANLRLLTLGFTGVTDRSVDVLLHAPYWRLSGLGLDGCDLSSETVHILAQSPRLARLNWLNLAANPRLSGDALLPLAESPYLSRLCRLDVGGVYVGEKTMAALQERLGSRLSGSSYR
jgi:uncharacterized protein (TIGR02996 family)